MVDLPRADDPAPPGTQTESFLQRSATQAAIVVTIGLGLAVLRGWITGEMVTKDALATSIEAVVWAWLAAVGIARVGPPGLRRL